MLGWRHGKRHFGRPQGAISGRERDELRAEEVTRLGGGEERGGWSHASGGSTLSVGVKIPPRRRSADAQGFQNFHPGYLCADLTDRLKLPTRDSPPPTETASPPGDGPGPGPGMDPETRMTDPETRNGRPTLVAQDQSCAVKTDSENRYRTNP